MKPCIGHLTAQQRDVWSAQYEELMRVSGNAELMDVIGSAPFVVCLDLDHEQQPNGHAVDARAHSIMHCGSDNTGNRYYDKPINLVVLPTLEVSAVSVLCASVDGHRHTRPAWCSSTPPRTAHS